MPPASPLQAVCAGDGVAVASNRMVARGMAVRVAGFMDAGSLWWVTPVSLERKRPRAGPGCRHTQFREDACGAPGQATRTATHFHEGPVLVQPRRTSRCMFPRQSRWRARWRALLVCTLNIRPGRVLAADRFASCRAGRMCRSGCVHYDRGWPKNTNASGPWPPVQTHPACRAADTFRQGNATHPGIRFD